MMSEIALIGQRMEKHLLASELLSSIEQEQQQQSLILTLHAKPGICFSERVMRFCLNFQGEQHSLEQERSIFVWCASSVDTVSETICRVHIDCRHPCGYMGFDVLSEVLVLGLHLSQSLVLSSFSYALENLMQIYRKKEEVLATYARFVSQVILAEDDLPTQECEEALRDLWLCCPKHRYLFVQRLILNDWLHHIIWNADMTEGYDERPYMKFLREPAPVEEIKHLLANLLVQTFTPQHWLQARLVHSKHVEENHWALPTKTCQRKHHVNLACCPFHITMMAVDYLFGSWLAHFDAVYHMSSIVDEDGHTSGLFSINGIALLIHLAKLDTSTLTFPEWLQEVPSVDMQKFHIQEEIKTLNKG